MFVAKSESQNTKKSKASKSDTADLAQMSEDLRSASGKLLETSGSMHSFMQGLSTSGFRDYVDYMGKPWYILWFNFLVGVARGLGFVIGATVLVAFFLWIMSRILTQLPFVGNFFEIMTEFFSPENLEKIKSGQYLESVEELLDTFKLDLTGTSGTIEPPK